MTCADLLRNPDDERQARNLRPHVRHLEQLFVVGNLTVVHKPTIEQIEADVSLKPPRSLTGLIYGPARGVTG
jgi:hypothetical protein